MWVFLLLLPGLGSGPSVVLLTRNSAGCEDRAGSSQGVGGNEWAAGWKRGTKWRGRAHRNWGGGEGKLGKLGAGAAVWDHEDILSLGLGAEAGLLTPLLSVNICEQRLDMCVSCLLFPSVSFCERCPGSAANFSRGDVCCGCEEVTLFQPAKLGSPCFHLLASRNKKGGDVFPRKGLHWKTNSLMSKGHPGDKVKHLPSREIMERVVLALSRWMIVVQHRRGWSPGLLP